MRCPCRCADYVVINKVDLLALQSADGVDQLAAIVSSLNPLATVFRCENGVIPIDKIFGREAQARARARLACATSTRTAWALLTRLCVQAPAGISAVAHECTSLRRPCCQLHAACAW